MSSSEEGNDASASGSEGENENVDEPQTEELSGWADSMSKILRSTKPKNKKNLMLSRARKDYEVNKTEKPVYKKSNDIEIVKAESNKNGVKDENAEDGDGKDNTTEDSDVLSMKHQRKLELRQRKLEKEWENLNRITSANPDRETEVDLLKIATKGVVQLFNAVAQQQKTLKVKLRGSGKSEFRKEKVLSQSKDLFDKAMVKNKVVGKESESEDDDDDMDIKQEEGSSSDDEGSSFQNEPRKRKLKPRSAAPAPSKKPMWQALQDDFMLDAKLKDWDKDSDDD